MLTLVPPANCDGPYKMDFGATHVEVDPTIGARVSALRVGGVTGTDILANATMTGTPIDWGSTFWPSPQTWTWPPSTGVPAIDPDPYTCANAATSFTLTSGQNPTTGGGPAIVVTKKFSADLTKEAVVINYTITNKGNSALMVAPWEISRVPAGALSFYPENSPPGTRTGSTFALPTTTTSAGGIRWYQHNPADATQYKLFADGKGGWLASVVGKNVFVKQFDDVPAAAQFSTEAEIELYSAQQYVEVEQQGAMQSLAAGATLTWTVRWYVRPIPAGVSTTAGSADLVTFVEGLVQ